MIRYETDFAGVVTIRPRLSDAFVASFNEVASRRNNTLGDGDKGSFDDLVFGNRGAGAGPAIDGRPHNPIWTGVPSLWNNLRLFNGSQNRKEGRRTHQPTVEQQHTWTTLSVTTPYQTALDCGPRSNFYNYVQWLQFVVDYIVKENPEEELALDFQGSITWIGDRTGSDDQGTLTVTHQLRSLYTKFVRGGYLAVLLPGPNKQALVEPVDEAVLTDDPYEQPECQLTDPAEPRREVYVKLRLRPLLELCLSAAATNLAKMTDPAQARQLMSRLPEELQAELKGGRHCSGCGCLFVGAAAVDVLVWVPIGATGQPILGRYCSVPCWGKEETDARKRIDVELEPLDEED